MYPVACNPKIKDVKTQLLQLNCEVPQIFGIAGSATQLRRSQSWNSIFIDVWYLLKPLRLEIRQGSVKQGIEGRK